MREPLTEEDMDDLVDYLTSLSDTVKGYFDRMRTQTQGNSPISDTLWASHCALNQEVDRLTTLRRSYVWPKGK